MANFTWVDYVILIIYALSIFAGFARGLVKEIISLITLIAAFVIATLFASPLAQMFTGSSTVQNAVSHSSTSMGVATSEPVSYLALGISFAIIFAGVVILGAIISTILNLAFQVGVLGMGNRILGAVFGFVRAFLITLVIIFVIQLTPFSNEPSWRESKLVNAYQPSMQWLGNIVSPNLANLKEKFGSQLENLNTPFQNMGIPQKQQKP